MHPTIYLPLFFLTLVQSANIFCAFPMPMKSHHTVFNSLIEALAAKGHNLTVLTTDPLDHNGKYPNLNQIDLHDVSYKIWNDIVNYGAQNESSSTAVVKGLLQLSEVQLNMPDVKKIIDDPFSKFDICLIECWVEPMFAFKDRFNCSLVLVSSTSASFTNFDAFGNPTNPTLFMDVISPYYGDLNFWQRMHSVYINAKQRYLYYYILVPVYDKIIKRNFGNDSRSIIDIHNDADMLFVYGSPILSGNRPVVPGIIHIDNIHIKPVKPLPHILKKILDESKEDVIYFSLGSNLQMKNLQNSILNIFLDSFKELPYTILMKWENEMLLNKPDNVHIYKWMPQQDILAHPKVKAFITQGGYQSFEEAIFHKVPMIGLPFAIDQKMNVLKMVKFGIGIGLETKGLSKTIVTNSILKIMNDDDKYHENIEKLSNLINDQPQKSLDRAIWWIEYVIRNKGAKHLRSFAADVSFAKYFLFDIIGFVLGIITLIIIIIIFIISTIKKCISKKSYKEKSS